MKLSEAIRLGAMLGPQGRGVLTDGLKTCALGAALEAIGWTDDQMHAVNSFRELSSQFPILNQLALDPVTGKEQRVVHITIMYSMNDHWEHPWTREAIADWVESIEPQPAPVVPAREDVEVVSL